MHYSNGLEYIIRNSYNPNSYNISYLFREQNDDYKSKKHSQFIETELYGSSASRISYSNKNVYMAYIPTHSFMPEFFLNSLRPKTRITQNNNEARIIAEEIFINMMGEKLPSNISISILPLDEFKELHSLFGQWNNGILGFSINGKTKNIFVRENHFDELILVIGHEIGHVLNDTLPNIHDEEAKAFAFSIEWAKTIKEKNIGHLGLNIKDEFNFQPAKNGLHDVAFEFVNLMINMGKKAIELHNDLVKKYVSVFNILY